MKRILKFLTFMVTIVLLLVACNTTDENQEIEAPVEEENTPELLSEADDDSDYSGVTLQINNVIDTPAPDGPATGLLQLEISFINTTDNTINMPFSNDDYAILDSAGLNIVPTSVSPELIMPELSVGESVEGMIEYAVADVEGTFIFGPGTYTDITLSPSQAD